MKVKLTLSIVWNVHPADESLAQRVVSNPTDPDSVDFIFGTITDAYAKPDLLEATYPTATAELTQ